MNKDWGQTAMSGKSISPLFGFRFCKPLVLSVLFAAIFGIVAPGGHTPAVAQSDVETGLDVFPNLSLGNLNLDEDQSAEPVTFSAAYSPAGDGKATVSVTAKMSPDWHVYSLTQAKGGPTPTTLTVSGPDGVKLAGDWKPSVAAKIKSYDAWPGLAVEEHEGTLVWSAPVAVPAGFAGEIEVAVSSLVCKTDGSCVPLKEKLKAKAAASDDAAPAADMKVAAADKPAADGDKAAGETTFRNAKSVVQWTGEIVPAEAAPGTTATLRITAKPDSGYHVYAAAVDDTESRTNFVVTEKAGLKFGKPEPPTPPIVKTILPSLPPVEYHEGEITWSIPVEIGDDVTPGQKTVTGLIGYQACTDTSCLQPKALQFTATIDVTPMASEAEVARAVRFVTAPYGKTMDAAAETDWVDPLGKPSDAGSAANGSRAVPADPKAAAPLAAADGPAALATSPMSLALILLTALAGGVILNLMPCVLPVVGLKIMSFASQAGENRGKVLALNVAYTLGILVVFWALSALAIVSTYSWGRELLGIEGQMSWGQQFQYFGFRYGVILLVFALALSFLGVWEIPLPGFVGGKSTQQLQKKEGFSGAFFKGIFTTVLATPCSGPLLGTVFAYTLGKSAIVIWSIFTAIGLGMAAPYLLVALFPPLIAFLPKPGEWMDTLKQLLGFVLLGTVVFIFTFFPDSDHVMVFASLIGVWFGCWIVGRVPGWETLPKRMSAWAGGIVAAAAICYLAIWSTTAGPTVLAWEPYDQARLEQLRREGRTVMIDFTANWCINCQLNYKVAINTEKTSRMIAELNAVPMLADWTDNNEEIRSKLQELNSNSIPVLAFYPGSDPANPIVLRDLVSQGDVLEALKQAGPSIASAGSSRPAVASAVTSGHDR